MGRVLFPPRAWSIYILLGMQRQVFKGIFSKGASFLILKKDKKGIQKMVHFPLPPLLHDKLKRGLHDFLHLVSRLLFNRLHSVRDKELERLNLIRGRGRGIQILKDALHVLLHALDAHHNGIQLVGEALKRPIVSSMRDNVLTQLLREQRGGQRAGAESPQGYRRRTWKNFCTLRILHSDRPWFERVLSILILTWSICKSSFLHAQRMPCASSLGIFKPDVDKGLASEVAS